MEGEGVFKKVKYVFGLALKVTVTAILAIFLLETGVRVVLQFSLNRYLTQSVPQPYGRIMQKVGKFDYFDAASVNKFDPLCYYLPQGGFFRGPQGRTDAPKEKAPGETRIICIGDSTTYGWAVDYNHSWVTLLGETLAENYPEKNIRVLNAGLPGASSRQIKRFFQFYIVTYHPDILIWRGGSMLSDTYFVKKTEDTLRFLVWRCLYESRIFRVICVLLESRTQRPENAVYDFITGQSGSSLSGHESAGKFDSDLSMVKKIAEEHGTRYVLQVENLIYDNNKGVIHSELGFPSRAPHEPFVPTFASFTEGREKDPSKALFVDNVHLTEAGEAITAREISKFIINHKWIETFN